MTKCPECDAEIKIAEDAMEGEIVHVQIVEPATNYQVGKWI